MQYVALLVGIFSAFIGISEFRTLRKKKPERKYFIAVVISLLIAITLEVFTFNYGFFELPNHDYAVKKYQTSNQSHNTSESLGTNNIELTKVVEEAETKYTLNISGIDTKVRHIGIQLSGDFDIADCNYKFCDEANKNFQRTESDGFKIVPGVENSGRINTTFAGKVNTLNFTFSLDLNENITDVLIVLNEHPAFSFEFLRITIIFFLLLFGFIISITLNKEETLETNKLRRLSMKNKWTKCLFVFIVFIEVLFMVSLAYGSKKDFGFFQPEWKSEDIYQELTKALSKGKVDLNALSSEALEAEQQGIEQLEALDNPYEWAQRMNINCKWDHAFYHGKYYCYFGIVPAVLCYLPVYLIFGKMLNTQFLAIMLAMLAAVFMIKLVYDIAKNRGRKVNIWVVTSIALGYVNASMLLINVVNSKFYEVARLSGLVTALIGIDLIYNAVSKKCISSVRLLFGAWFLALSVGCRPNYIFVSFLALILVGHKFTDGMQNKGLTFLQKVKCYFKNIFCRENRKAVLCFVVPYILIGIGLMYYNYIRFDSVFEFGAKYQLTVYDVSYYSMFDLGKIPTAIYDGLLTMPDTSASFPFFSPALRHNGFLGYFYKTTCLGVMCFPLMWLIALIPWSAKRLTGNKRDKYFMIGSFVLGLFSCYFTAVMGGTGIGYNIDFAWLLYIPVIYIALDLYDYAKEKKMERPVTLIIITLTVLTALFMALICFSEGAGNIAKTNPTLFYKLKEMFIFFE